MMKTPHNVERRQQTADLISRLAEKSGPQLKPLLDQTLVGATMLALVGAVATVFVITQPRTDLGLALTSWAMPFKASAMSLLIGGAFAMLRCSAMPGCAVRSASLLLPVVLLLGTGVAIEGPNAGIFGAHRFSILTCMGTIILASIVPLAIMLGALRRGVPTRLHASGAYAGILAGALGGLAYSITCINDSAAFVALWYVAAIAIVGAVGAIVAPKLIAW